VPERLPLPKRLSAEGWKVKIRDLEHGEPPHATVIRGTTDWRWDLRSRKFMDRKPNPRDVRDQLVRLLRAHDTELVRAWDATFPDNPVGPREDA
jgi:hypothetical protein